MSAPSDRHAAEGRLDSWKEIAAYLGREVRTVQGWEKTEGLPVHRHQHARQGSVYAFKAELDAWRNARKAVAEPAAEPLQAASGDRKYILIAVAVLALMEGGVLLWKLLQPKPPGAAISSIAVLPFLDFSPNKDQEYFSDGLTEEIIDAISRVPNLRVVARTSAFAFKGKPADIRQIGAQLGVGAVIEGSVRKSGDELRITAQLNRVLDGSHLWSRTYQRRLRDVFAVQREISEAIAGELRAGQVPAGEPPRNVTDGEAYRLLQEGRYFFNQFQPPESNRKAIERYRQAIARDPRLASAYAGLADAYAYQAENFASAPKEVMPKAREAAHKAVELDENSAAAHTSLGIVLLDYDRDIAGGQHEFQRAIQLNPGSGYSHHWYAHSLEAQGRLPEAMKEMRAALDLDPLSVPINWDIGSELMWANRYQEAVRHLAKAHDLFPNNPIIEYLRAEAFNRVGDREASRKVVDSLRTGIPELANDPIFLALFGLEALREGRRGDAMATLDRMDSMSRTQYVEPFMALELCSELADRAKLLDWLRRADRERSTLFVYLPLFKEAFHLDAGALAEFEKSRRTN
jgi:TolB-like protein/cytochrome c-type biogenesis protein CcmH/NrfG